MGALQDYRDNARRRGVDPDLAAAVDAVSEELKTSGGAGTASIAFASIVSAGTASIPLNVANTILGRYVISGALTIQPGANPVGGSSATAQLVANGTNTPTFSGFTELSGSSGWVNTNGIRNLVQFLYDGFVYWYSVQQDVALSPIDLVAPTLSSAVIATTSGGIALTFSETMLATAGGTPADGDYAITASGGAVTVTGTTFSTNVAALALSRSMSAGETVSLSYTPSSNRFQDPSGNLYVPSNPISVTNNISSVVLVRWSGSAASGVITETGDGTNGWVYQGTVGGLSSDQYFSLASTQKIPVGAWISLECSSGFPSFDVGMIYVSTSATPVAYNTATVKAALYGYAGDYYRCVNNGVATITSGTGYNTSGASTYEGSNRYRLRRTADTTYVAEASTDGGSTWNTIYTYTVDTGGTHYVYMSVNDTSRCYRLRGSGLSA